MVSPSATRYCLPPVLMIAYTPSASPARSETLEIITAQRGISTATAALQAMGRGQAARSRFTRRRAGGGVAEGAGGCLLGDYPPELPKTGGPPCIIQKSKPIQKSNRVPGVDTLRSVSFDQSKCSG